ncbi:MAG: hypothetical protein H0V27_00385 [Pyrinomonadaceae bacterium]|nr:hypothetical protein [Pyrinomonadaceae bacterium]
MKQPKTRLHFFAADSHKLPHRRTAFSLHCHTHHSKENLGFIPHYATRISVAHYERRRVTAKSVE